MSLWPLIYLKYPCLGASPDLDCITVEICKKSAHSTETFILFKASAEACSRSVIENNLLLGLYKSVKGIGIPLVSQMSHCLMFLG